MSVINRTTGHADLQALMSGEPLPKPVRTAATSVLKAMNGQEQALTGARSRAVREAVVEFEQALTSNGLLDSEFGRRSTLAIYRHEQSVLKTAAAQKATFAPTHEETEQLAALLSRVETTPNRGLFFRFEEGVSAATVAPSELIKAMQLRPGAKFYADRLHVQNPNTLWERTSRASEFAFAGGPGGLGALKAFLEESFSPTGPGASVVTSTESKS